MTTDGRRHPVLPGTDGDDRGVHQFSLAFEDLGLTTERVMAGMGYKSGAGPDLAEEIEALLLAAGNYMAISGGFRIFLPASVTIADDAVTCGPVTFGVGHELAKLLRGAEGVAVFVATAGQGIGTWSHDLMDAGDMMRGFIVDTIGSIAVERAADFLEGKIADVVQDNGWAVTNRYSPGYCGWTVAEQHRLFSLLPDAFCGIRLTESALMVPIKSVSGIIGLGANVKREEYECSLCDLPNCFRRRSRVEEARNRKQIS